MKKFVLTHFKITMVLVPNPSQIERGSGKTNVSAEILKY